MRERAAELASAAGITIEHIAKNHIRKEVVVARVLVVRGVVAFSRLLGVGEAGNRPQRRSASNRHTNICSTSEPKNW